MDAERTILHVDMDAFYASIEQRDRPELRGKPLVVGGGGNRGVVAAASYESRRYGVRSAMPMREARRRCPELERVAPRMSHYQSVSRQVFAVFREFTPLVEGLSLDEAFLDVTASRALFGDGIRIARAIKDRIRSTTTLTASVGVAPNKLVAKIASDLDKPDGLVVVSPEDVTGTLDPLRVQVIPGIGKATLRRLNAHGIETIRDLRCAPAATLERVFGRFAGRMRDRASGIDHRAVVSSRAEKSISTEQTFDVDLSDAEIMHAKLLALAERTTSRLRAKSLACATVQVKIRRADFATYTRQRRLHPPSNDTDQVYAAARELLCRWLSEHPGAELRLLGVGASDLVPASQRDLFAAAAEDGQKSTLDQAVDAIRGRFGSAAVARARSKDRDQIR